MNPNRHTLRHTVIKMAKIKDRVFLRQQEKNRVNYKGTPVRLSTDFSTEMLQARREW